VDGGGREIAVVANGLAVVVELVGGENGFVVRAEEVENGFSLPLRLDVALVPKKLLPMFCGVVFVVCSSLSVGSMPFPLDLAFSSTGLTRTPRKPLTLPCFR